MSNFTFQILHSKERQLLDEIAGVGKFHERHFRFLKSLFRRYTVFDASSDVISEKKNYSSQKND